ncbi:PAAR domain-containing protein [Burkholderia stagnalis]
MKNPIRLGDATTHGGIVKTASSTFDLDGRKVALLHDVVSCPEHGDNPISSAPTATAKAAVNGWCTCVERDAAVR